MYRLQIVILLAFFGAAPLWVQEPATDDATDNSEQPEEEAVAPESDVSDEEIEELLGLDEDYTEAEDDDFDPTDEVRFEQSIAFPVDI